MKEIVLAILVVISVGLFATTFITGNPWWLISAIPFIFIGMMIAPSPFDQRRKEQLWKSKDFI